MDYFRRLTTDKLREVDLGVVCVTIADQGTGIQNTLPIAVNSSPNEEPESAHKRFLRAFRPGESRKSAGPIKRGIGLPTAVEAAFKLDAMIDIWSGNVRCLQDFTNDETRYPGLKFENIVDLPDGLNFGTAVTIFLPEFTDSPDQIRISLD